MMLLREVWRFWRVWIGIEEGWLAVGSAQRIVLTAEVAIVLA